MLHLYKGEVRLIETILFYYASLRMSLILVNDLNCVLMIYFSQNLSISVDAVRISSSEMNSDVHASAEYRANMVKVFAKKAVEAC
mgnify:CR=1 FL=1